MMQFDRITLGRKAKELGFVRDTFEKVCRLAEVLRVMEADTVLSPCLALKGGTAINLTIFDLPRLSVDIDLDYSKAVSRDEMLAEREEITSRIKKYMTAAGYALGSRSKSYHALDSFVFEYQNAAGMRDNLKIEINYMIRCHVLPVERRVVRLPWLEEELTVLSVSPLEIFGSKIVALLNRTAPRDLYDIRNMMKFGTIAQDEEALLRKIVMFYAALGSDAVPEAFAIDSIPQVQQFKIKSELVPVLRQGEWFEAKTAQREIAEYLSRVLVPDAEELSFWQEFSRKQYRPELLFKDEEVVGRVKLHPMAAWKCR